MFEVKEGIGASVMTRDKLKVLVVLGSLLTAIGVILLFFSVNFGTLLAENWLVKEGGMDTATYLIIMEGNINNFLAAGIILFGIGILTILFAYYKMLNINE